MAVERRRTSPLLCVFAGSDAFLTSIIQTGLADRPTVNEVVCRPSSTVRMVIRGRVIFAFPLGDDYEYKA